MIKPAIFHPAARETIRGFPIEARKELGKAIYDLQLGERLSMPLSRPMTSVASGAAELRIRDRATPLLELNIGRSRLKELLHEED